MIHRYKLRQLKTQLNNQPYNSGHMQRHACNFRVLNRYVFYLMEETSTKRNPAWESMTSAQKTCQSFWYQILELVSPLLLSSGGNSGCSSGSSCSSRVLLSISIWSIIGSSLFYAAHTQGIANF